MKTYKQPMTPWPKKKDLKHAGGLMAATTDTSYHAYGMTLLTRGLGWKSEDADALFREAQAAHMDRKCSVHAYNHL